MSLTPFLAAIFDHWRSRYSVHKSRNLCSHFTVTSERGSGRRKCALDEAAAAYSHDSEHDGGSEREEEKRIKTSEQTPRQGRSTCSPSCILTAVDADVLLKTSETFGWIQGQVVCGIDCKFVSKHLFQLGINPPCRSHFQTASPNLVSPRSTPLICPPTRFCDRRSSLGCQHTGTFSACNIMSMPDNS